ncbi:mannose-1-phosphate guanylyltransferase [Syntrophomonas palmitatica]|uniref:mannose-1-phosphate guanylyltransferase n=1 Tax=Syntrophomonas palmitatica TaxID=402877 RepID=UPI0006D1C750|nr:sugar phosphate nucleotidyltransferase [Syntrophomonas palmitatica]
MIAVVLAGGRGLRLWPESRRQRPKQLCKLVGSRSMLDHTLDRLIQAGSSQIIIITSDELNADIADLIKQRPDADIIEILSEPEGKNTAPAVGLVLSKYMHTMPDEVLGIFPADHHILNPAVFAQSIERACQAAKADNLVTIGITPQRPETGFGYIERSKWEISTLPDVFPVDSFLEKPDSATAAKYMQSGQHLWNAGIYIGKLSLLAQEFSTHLPVVYEKMLQGFEHYLSSYAELPNISLDYAIAEKSNHMAVVPAEFGWSDLGSWNALAEITPADESGNICNGQDIILQNCKDCLVRQLEKTVVLFGMENLLVVETSDLIFIAPRDKDQEIKQIVQNLEILERHDLL